MKHYGDITKINGVAVEPVNVIIGGSPCQDLSVAGRQKGLQGERSGLFMEQLRVIKEMRRADRERGRNGKDTRPRYMVWENVPGAFSSNKGADFGIVLQETIKVACEQAPAVPIPKNGWPPAGCLTDVGGQWSIAWRVFDAQFWGVPQRRKRIALVADFGGLTAPEILFERQGVPGYITPCGKEGQGSPGNIETSTNTASPTGGDQVAFGISSYASNSMLSSNPHSGIYEADTSRTLDLNCGNPACNQGGIAVVSPFTPPLPEQLALEHHPHDNRIKIAEDGVVQTLNARMGTGGGMFPSYCVRMRAGCEGGGKGALIQTEKSGTLCPGNDQTLFVPNISMFENYQFANWRPGCGTLKASGGDYGGERKLDRLSVLER